MNRRMVVLAGGLVLAGAWTSRGLAADAPGPAVLLASGFAFMPRDKGEAPQEIPHPDISRIVIGPYSDKAGGAAALILSRESDRILVRLVKGGLPPMKVVFGKPATMIGGPPPRPGGPLLGLVFLQDSAGRLMLSGMTTGDVGGDLFFVG